MIREKNVKLFLVIITVFTFFLILINFPTTFKFLQNKSKENSTTETLSVMEFPPLTLCKKTDGSWKEVPANEYPLNETAGVYNPTTNKDVNYKCFCSSNMKWNASWGCI